MRLSLVFFLCSAVVGMPLQVQMEGKSEPTNLQVVQNFKLQQLETGERSENQPFHNQLKVSYSLFGKDFEHELFINTELHSADGVVTVDHVVQESRPQLQSYRSAHGEYPIVSAYMYNEKQIHAVIAMEDDIYTIDPVDEHLSNPHLPTTLSAEKGTSMVGYKLSELPNLPFGMPDLPSNPSKPSSRKLLQQLYRFEKCWPGQNSAGKSILVSFAADTAYFQFCKSKAAVEGKIQQMVQDANIIYGPQMDIYLKIQDYDIRTKLDQDPWNQQRPATGKNCAPSTSVTLGHFRAWKGAKHPKDAGLWHLMTDCYRPSGVVGVAFVGTLCSTSYGCGLSSDHGSGTWRTVAHEIGHNFGAGHSFQDGKGKTGGIMDYADGKYPVKTGRYQFHPKYSRDPVCNEITATMNKPAHDKCWVNGGGAAPSPLPSPSATPKPTPKPSTYTWKTALDYAGAICSKTCGGGLEVQPVTCVDQNSKKVSDTLCSGKKPFGVSRACNTQACAPKCGDGKIEGTEVCDDPSDSCCINCQRRSTENKCQLANPVRDACFASTSTGKLYVFQGANYVRYSSLSNAEGAKPDAGYPKRISAGWTKLDKFFHDGIDAAVPTADDSVFFIKGTKVTKYHFGSGQVNTYPRDLAKVFPGLKFTTVDDAVNIPGGAYFFKDDEYHLFLWQAPTVSTEYPRPIGDWGLDFTSIDASVNIESENAVDFYKGNQKVRYIWGEGQKTKPVKTAGLEIGDDTLVTTVCPANCISCVESSFCQECDEGYVAQSDGTCSSQLYLTEFKFENKELESKLIKSSNVPDSAWVSEGGATGGGLVLKPENRIELELMSNPRLPNFQLHLWVHLAKITKEPQKICTVNLKDDRIITWSLEENNLIENEADRNISMLLVLRVGEIVIIHPSPVYLGDWHHLMGIMSDGFATAMVDSNSMTFPYDDQGTEDGTVLSDDVNKAEVFELVSWSLGADEGQTNGLDAIIDTFHIAAKLPPPDVSSATSISTSLVMVIPLVAAAALALF